MRHPCADHPCDHCYLCDVVGVCCATVSAEQQTQIEAHLQVELDRLRQAIVCEAASTPTLADRLRGDMQCPPATRLLPAATRLGLGAAPAADAVSPDSRKEALHVIPARSK